MSATTLPTSQTSGEGVQLKLARPSFIGLIRSELIRAARRWSTWICFIILVLGPLFMAELVRLNNSNLKAAIADPRQYVVYSNVAASLAIFRAFSGIYLLIMVAYIIGLEYQLGTIRIVLARGVNKVSLLLAKLCTSIIMALAALVVGLAFITLTLSALLLIVTGNLNGLTGISGQLWSNIGLDIVTILINMVVTILVGTTLSIVGKSFAFGLSASLIFFPMDNIGGSLTALITRLTNNTFWTNSTAYFLGLNLNAMAAAVLPTQPHIPTLGTEPQVAIDGTHTLLVALVYAVICIVVSVVVISKRDIKE